MDLQHRIWPILFLASIVGAQAPDPVPGRPSGITAEILRRHASHFASDEMKGRQAGTPENENAAAYIIEHMTAAGLKPKGDGSSFLHAFPIPGRVIQNVLGVLPGKGLPEQFVVVGAHYDHVGLGTFGSRGSRTGEIHNGADDNASGSAALLALMAAFAHKPPRRSLLFAAFNAEEMGLLGSKAFVARPTIPMANVQAMINLDMIGRSKDRYLFLGGLQTAVGLKELVVNQAKPYRFDLELAGGGRGPSDFDPFYGAQKPVMFFFTGEHPDYHLPEDDVERLELDTEADIVDLAFRCIRSLADGRRLVWQADDRTAMPATSERALDQARYVLGLGLKPGDDGAQVVDVDAKGSAAGAGVAVGDLMVSIAGVVPTRRPVIDRALAPLKLGDKVEVEVRRGTKSRKLKLRLGSP